MDINWYPGHMARAKRLLSDQLSRVDVVIELCDARLPRSSRNPDLQRLMEKKQRVLILGKSETGLIVSKPETLNNLADEIFQTVE